MDCTHRSASMLRGRSNSVPINPMLHFDYEAVLSSLSPAEIEKGTALRIPRCVRGSHQGEVSWVVLHVCKRNDSNAVPVVQSFPFPSDNSPTIYGPLITSVSASAGVGVWYVREFEVVLPLSLRMFSIACGGATLRMTWRRRNVLLDAHYEEIAHAATDRSYPDWISAHRRRVHVSSSGPLMSIVSPVYRTPPEYLSAMINSVLGQSYKNWELVIVNASPDDSRVSRVLSTYRDDRIRVIDHPENDGISGNTNLGIAAAQGDYVSFLDHDDVVEPDALASMVDVIVGSEQRVDLLYCDEDSLNEEGLNCLPLFKPSLNPDLLYSNNYAIHWLTVSKEILDEVSRSGRDVDGAQDYDLTLKAIEVSKAIVRIPRILYHWRIHSGSTNVNPDSKPYAQLAGAKAIGAHFDRCNLRAEVTLEDVPCTYKSVFDVQNPAGSIACLLATSESFKVLECAAHEYEHSVGQPCDVVNISSDDVSHLKDALVSTKASLILFCRSSIGEIDADFLAVMAGYFQRDDVAAVAPKVIRKDGLVDYAGACMCPNGDMMYLNRFLPQDDGGYVGRAQRPYDGLVLNPDCFMVRKELLEAFLLEEERLGGTALWCLEMFAGFFAKGLRNVYTPFACLYESNHKTLLDYGVNDFDEEAQRSFVERCGGLIAGGDPSHNPNFDAYSPYYKLGW